MWKNILSIGIGGALGTITRYFLNLYTLFVGYPIGTVIENILGSFLLGILTAWFLNRKSREWVKVGVGVGFCGGFTTMSTLAADSFFLVQEVSILSFLIYLFLSLFGGLTLAFMGLLLGTKWSGEKTNESEGGLS
ncbi:CrcB family protein [Bacillus tamaricis]|uniref:Fluoride-specific ion channel FluC n=2 Tax=Evansella tamaricis TaxID=2069301 RepID=A0ABS6JF55_9BACI|nr:CrcB family protein [Evansella tamaricis]MBU9712306.1 CrcB family protein [Evansella tamaricis]